MSVDPDRWLATVKGGKVLAEEDLRLLCEKVCELYTCCVTASENQRLAALARFCFWYKICLPHSFATGQRDYVRGTKCASRIESCHGMQLQIVH